ncbi:MAG: redoxin family protein, partial [Paracoccaceae bacterium]|nr:redoxin family protein [Paracoccaceae bacterium]
CRAEHQSFIKLSRNDDIELVGINYKDNDKDALDWLTELGNPYTYVGNDFSGRTGIDWGITGVPETFIVNKNGKVVHRFSGPLVGKRFEEFKELLMLELK